MLTIYGVYRSRASRNIWLLGEGAIPFEHVPVIQAYRLPDPAAPDAPMHTASPAFRAISPAGAVPVMTDGDLVLSESLAINLHIARTRGGDLGPRDAAEDALMQQWALYGATAIEPHAVAILYAHAEGRADTAEGKAELAALKERLQRPFAVLDAHLAGAGHMVGGRFTVADINMAEIVRYAQAETAFMSGYPALDAWLKTAQARPAFQKMWQRRLTEPA